MAIHGHGLYLGWSSTLEIMPSRQPTGPLAYTPQKQGLVIRQAISYIAGGGGVGWLTGH